MVTFRHAVMWQTIFLNYVALLVRIAVLVPLIGVVVFCLRYRVSGDRRYRAAIAAGLAVFLAGLGRLLFKSPVPLDGISGLLQLNVDLLMLIGAAAVVWISCHAGILLGDTHGGYWTKQSSRLGPAWVACLFGTGLSMMFSLPFFVALDVPMPLAYSLASPAEWGGYMCKAAGHSFGEEVFFRGWCLVWLGTFSGRLRLRFWSANLLTAAIFALQHEGGFYQVLTAFWSGLILGEIFRRHGLIAAASTHLLLNLVVLVFP